MQSEQRTNVIIGTVCLIIGVVLGALAGTWVERRSGDERMAAAVDAESAIAGRFEVEVNELHKSADLMRLHLRLGRIAMLADRQDYGAAGEAAGTFFDEAARLEERMKSDDKAHASLQQLLAVRDEITAGLATAQPGAAQTLRQFYLDLFDAMN